MSTRILVIDDESSVRQLVRLVLEAAGYQVSDACDGPSGLAQFADGSGWDLVLVDQRMPGMSGLEVQKEILKRSPLMKIILITAHGTMELALDALQAGALDFLRKPFSTESLRLAVSSTLERAQGARIQSPVGTVCREFTRTTINGYSFDFEEQTADPDLGDLTLSYRVNRANQHIANVKVFLPAYIMELTRALADTEELPGGARFWQAMGEEALAMHLWNNAELPAGNNLTIEDVTPSLRKWLDSLLTVSLAD